MVSKDDIFTPMLILTNYDNGYKKLVNELKNDLRKSKSSREKEIILKECKSKIKKWHVRLMIKCSIIFIISLIILTVIHFYFNYNEIFSSIIILIYILCFSLDKYQNKENLIDEIENYASDILFVTMDDIIIR